MNDPRSDSLAADLKRAKRFDEYMSWCAETQPLPNARLEKILGWGIQTSISSIYRMHKSGAAFAWRVGAAAEARKIADQFLPKDMEEGLREAILDQRFNAALGEMTQKEVIAHATLELEERKFKAKIALEKDKLALGNRRVRLLEEAASSAKEKLNAVVAKGGLSEEARKQIEEAAGLL